MINIHYKILYILLYDECSNIFYNGDKLDFIKRKKNQKLKINNLRNELLLQGKFIGIAPLQMAPKYKAKYSNEFGPINTINSPAKMCLFNNVAACLI